MAKMKLFVLLFSFFNLLLISWTPILASNEMGTTRLEQCNLPAPDSFRITQVGGDLIKLAWNPIFPGAQHQLIIMESDGNGGYVTILVENNVSGDTYNAGNLLPGTGYRFVLATKCASGDPSEVKTIIDGITLIVDLLVEGRKPVSPTTINGCEFIPAENNWVGFNIYKLGENFNDNNYFEVKRESQETIGGNSQARTKVLRHNLNGEIFATTLQGLWPDCDIKKRSIGGTRFRVDHKLQTGIIEIVGYVDIYFNSNPPSFHICPDYSDLEIPWKPNYVFQPLYSMKSGEPEFCDEHKPSRPRSGVTSTWFITNPFSSEIQITTQKEEQSVMVYSIQLFNLMGELVFDVPIDSSLLEAYIPTTNLADGIYIMLLRTNKGSETQKIIKTAK